MNPWSSRIAIPAIADASSFKLFSPLWGQFQIRSTILDRKFHLRSAAYPGEADYGLMVKE
jgi:hypothetical protein